MLNSISSLWILKDWLEELSPVIQCKNERTEIAGTRLYQPDMQIKDDILFLDPSDNFFHDGDRRIVCRHRSDFRLTSNFAYALEGKPGALSALRRQLSLFEWDAEERFYLLFSFYQDRHSFPLPTE